MYSLELKNVTKVIGKNLIIDDVSFKLEKGKIYGLVGANGSGKSTILKIIMGLYSSTGEVFINGNNLKRSYKEVLSCIGGIVDYVSFYDFLTAYENLRYFALIYEVPLNRVDDVMKLVGLVKDKKNVKNFSLGMKQRLGIAISLANNPDFLILDEPINGLDPQGIVEIRELILKLNKERQITILISSHYLDELSKIATHYGFLDNGSIIKEISSEELMKKMEHKLELKVSNPKDFVKYFEENKISYEVMDNKTISVYGKYNLSKFINDLSKENLVPDEIHEQEETLENYYMNLIGGEKVD